jgi:hypothetical protein
MGWLITLVILVVLAWIPLGATIRYNTDGLSLKIIAGPIRLTVLPKKNKEEKSKKKPKDNSAPKKVKASSTQPATPKQEEKGGPITDFLPLVNTALDLLNAFSKKLRIDRLELKLIMAADDPCDLAVNYGRAWAAVGNLFPRLERWLVIKKRDVEVECDFEASQTVVIAHVDLTITLGRLLGILIWYGVRALKQFISINNKRKGGSNHE